MHPNLNRNPAYSPSNRIADHELHSATMYDGARDSERSTLDLQADHIGPVGEAPGYGSQVRGVQHDAAARANIRPKSRIGATVQEEVLRSVAPAHMRPEISGRAGRLNAAQSAAPIARMVRFDAAGKIVGNTLIGSEPRRTVPRRSVSRQSAVDLMPIIGEHETTTTIGLDAAGRTADNQLISSEPTALGQLPPTVARTPFGKPATTLTRAQSVASVTEQHAAPNESARQISSPRFVIDDPRSQIAQHLRNPQLAQNLLDRAKHLLSSDKYAELISLLQRRQGASRGSRLENSAGQTAIPVTEPVTIPAVPAVMPKIYARPTQTRINIVNQEARVHFDGSAASPPLLVPRFSRTVTTGAEPEIIVHADAIAPRLQHVATVSEGPAANAVPVQPAAVTVPARIAEEDAQLLMNFAEGARPFEMFAAKALMSMARDPELPFALTRSQSPPPEPPLQPLALPKDTQRELRQPAFAALQTAQSLMLDAETRLEGIKQYHQLLASPNESVRNGACIGIAHEYYRRQNERAGELPGVLVDAWENGAKALYTPELFARLMLRPEGDPKAAMAIWTYLWGAPIAREDRIVGHIRYWAKKPTSLHTWPTEDRDAFLSAIDKSSQSSVAFSAVRRELMNKRRWIDVTPQGRAEPSSSRQRTESPRPVVMPTVTGNLSPTPSLPVQGQVQVPRRQRTDIGSS